MIGKNMLLGTAGLLQKIAGKPADTSADRFRELTVDPFIRGAGHYGAKPWPFNYELAMLQCRGWVYRCAVGNAEAAAAVPLRMYVKKRTTSQMKMEGYSAKVYPTRKVSSKRMDWLRGEHKRGASDAVRRKAAELGEVEEVVNHPMLDLLRYTGPYYNGFDLAAYRFVCLELTGNAYHYVVMDDSLGRPSSLWPMPPHWTRVIPGDGSDERFVRAYTLGPNSTVEDEIDASRVLHFKAGVGLSGGITHSWGNNSRVGDLIYGMGKVEAAWSALGITNSERQYQKALFDNQGRPDYIVSVKGANEAYANRVNAKLKSIMRGAHNAGKWLTLGGETTVTPLSWNPKDLGTTESILEEIAGVFGYPITKLKANDPNRANAEMGDAGWMKDTIDPIIKRDEQALNQDGYVDLWGQAEDIFLAYDDPVPGDEEKASRLSISLTNAGHRTINEERADRGEEPIEGGDVLRFNGTSIEKLDALTPDPLMSLFGHPARVEPVARPKPEDDKPEDKPVPPAIADGADNVVEGEKLNGAQIAAASSVLEQAASGTMSRLVAIKLLIAVGIGDERATRMVDSAINDTPKPTGGGEEKPKAVLQSEDAGPGPENRPVDPVRGSDGDRLESADEHDGDGGSPSDDGGVSENIGGLDGGAGERERKDAGDSVDAGGRGDAADDAGEVDTPPSDPSKAENGAIAPPAGPAKVVSVTTPAKADEPVVEGKAANEFEVVADPEPDEPHTPEDWPESTKQYRVKVEALESDLADTARDDEPTSPAIKIYKLFAQLFADQAEDIASVITPEGKAIKRGKAAATDFPEDEDLTKILAARMDDAFIASLVSAMSDATQAGANAGIERLRQMMPSLSLEVGFDVTNPKVAQAIRDNALSLADDINRVTQDRIKRTLADGVDAGESVRQLSERVRNAGKEMSGERAERIARTESANGYVKGQSEGWKESGVVSGKRWLLAPSPCQFCEAVSKKFNAPIGMDENFAKVGDTIKGANGGTFKVSYRDIDGPALHVNCRCDLIPVLDGE